MMTIDVFFEELGTIFDKTPKPEQMEVYRQKLRRFSPEQLIPILNRLVEECRTFPKVADVFKIAEELGYVTNETPTRPIHHWQPSDCDLCLGEGRLRMLWKWRIEDRPGGRVEVQTIIGVQPYTAMATSPGPLEFWSVCRCRCVARDAPTLPKGWPKLKPDTPLTREVWI